ncbi:RILP-like protein 1 isoform X2 [Antennarius striatus]|uniref:RILP-like protein 1 isoform X2 n=1 Tax=Antennarius striatus TaxID=241820 RepID=UPI0035AE5700
METCVIPALDRPAVELTVVDVYDIAAVLGQDFERLIDTFGCESVVGVVPKVVRVLELLEVLVCRGAAAQEAEELRRELDRLRQERIERLRQERKHQEELELVEDLWKAEVQDLLTQITHLKAENKRLVQSLPLRESSIVEEDAGKQDDMSENERQATKKLQDLVDKQREEIRAKDQELTLKNKDFEAVHMQQQRLLRVNQDLRHRIEVMEAQGKALIQQRVELEVAGQAQRQQLGSLQLEVTKLKRELQGWELEREVTDVIGPSLKTSGMSSPAKMDSSAVPPSNSIIKPSSVWAECGGDPDFLASCFEFVETSSPLPTSSNIEKSSPLPVSSSTEKNNGVDVDEALFLISTETEPDEESDMQDEGSDEPHFTLQELRDVLQERNELKAQVFMLQEELAYYKTEEFEDDTDSTVFTPASSPCSASNDQPESGIRHLIFTAIMPMVAAGLISDDPTLMPIRRLLSST